MTVAGSLRALSLCLLVAAAAAPARPQAPAPDDLGGIEALVRQGRHVQAVEALSALPEPSGASDYLLGYSLIQLYRFAEAESALRRAVDDEPGNVDRLHALAKSLLEQGKNLAAIDALDRALAIESRPNLHFSRAMCALNAGRLDEARTDLEASLAGQTRNPEALYKLGQIALDRGRYPEARERFEACLAIAPGHLEARFALGVTELRNGRTTAAIEAFETVLAAVPGHVGALYNLARAFQQDRRPDEARATLERFRHMSAVQDEVDFLRQAVEKNPGNLEGRALLARKLLEIGKAEDALREALASRQLGPDRAATYRLMAEVFGRLGRQDDARRAVEFARRLEERR